MAAANEGTSKAQVTGFWSEKIFILTEDYEIRGYVFMPKTVKKNRVLSDILNGSKRFLAIKDAQIIPRKNAEADIEMSEFVQLNLDAIILMKPCLD